MKAVNCALSSLLMISSVICADTGQQIEAYDADLFNKDKRVFFANAEFLYWLVNESALQYAVKMDHEPWSQTQSTAAVGQAQNSIFNWSPGCRLSFGYFNAPHYWDFITQYTYVPSSGHTHVKSPKNGSAYLNGTWAQPDLGENSPPIALQEAKSNLRLNYTVLDFFCSRRFDPNEHLRLNLFGGLTTAFIHQQWSIHYKDLLDQTSLIRNRWRFDGVGLRLGAKIDWYMGCDLYLTASTSGGLLSGWYKNTSYQTVSTPLPNANPSLPIRNFTNEDHRLASTANVILGPSWQKRFTKTRIEIVTGYELTMWANLHEVYHSSVTAPTAAKELFLDNSILSLQGLTVRLSADF